MPVAFVRAAYASGLNFIRGSTVQGCFGVVGIVTGWRGYSSWKVYVIGEGSNER